MRRVVVTGMGVVSSIGNNKQEVLDSLKAGQSGIERSEEYAELGFRSHVHGSIKLDIDSALDRKLRRFMGDGAAFNYIAMQEAIEDSGLEDSEVSNERTGLIMGSGGTSTKDMCLAYSITKEKGPKAFVCAATASISRRRTDADVLQHLDQPRSGRRPRGLRHDLAQGRV